LASPNTAHLVVPLNESQHHLTYTSILMASLLAKMQNAKPATKVASGALQAGKVMATSYTSKKEVAVPDDFLIATPPDAQPIQTYHINFKDTPLPEYNGHFAVVLDNVLSQSECAQLIRYAEESAGAGEPNVQDNGWKTALVNVGPGLEVFRPSYRNSERIIWDDQEIVNRLWERCLQGEGIRERLDSFEGQEIMQGRYSVRNGEKWNMLRLNERMRFLKYGPGQFFKGTFHTNSIRALY
jgi:hypothetical protein